MDGSTGVVVSNHVGVCSAGAGRAERGYAAGNAATARAPAEGRKRARETTGWRWCSGLEAVGGTASVTSGSDHAMARGEPRRPPAEATERELPRREWERGLRWGAGSAVSGTSGRWVRGVVSGSGGACGAGRCDRSDLARVGVGTTGGSGVKIGRGGGRAIAGMEGGGG